MEATGLQCAEGSEPTASRVEHWHRVDPDVPGIGANHAGVKPAVVDQTAMGQLSALGKPRSAGRELNLRDIVRAHFRQSAISPP